MGEACSILLRNAGRARSLARFGDTRVYPKVSGLATWSEKCKLSATRCSCITINFSVASERVIPKVSTYFVID
jgi:hypothetical protein